MFHEETIQTNKTVNKKQYGRKTHLYKNVN